MQTNALAANAYAQTTRQVAPPRAVEHAAFQRVTNMLRAASEPTATIAERAQAIHLNTRLWTALAADLASPTNKLPTELRAQLFGLAEFSRKEGLRALSGEGALSELVDINSAIMRGLRGDAGDGAATDAADPAQPESGA